jgi:ribosomal protein S14
VTTFLNASAASRAAERCSFCGRRDVPIAGVWPSLAMCARCVELSHSILAEDDRRSGPAT